MSTQSGAHKRDYDMATRAKRHPIIDAQITDEKEFKERLKELDNMSGEEAKERLRTILEIIWEGRKKIAKGRKIRRVKEIHGR
ncbi:MAG: hypothetical protein QMC77_07955 [Methanocellales archaeon]|nr:hypothetical protein [Methanocellales archaeon]